MSDTTLSVRIPPLALVAPEACVPTGARREAGDELRPMDAPPGNDTAPPPAGLDPGRRSPAAAAFAMRHLRAGDGKLHTAWELPPQEPMRAGQTVTLHVLGRAVAGAPKRPD